MTTTDDLISAAKAAAAQGKPQIAANLIAAARRLASAPVNDVQMPPPAYGANGMAAEPTRPQPNRFGDVAGQMAAPPLAAASRFAAGVTDPSQSPTYNALPEGTFEPSRRLLALGGDTAMAGINLLGAGLAGAAGLVGEVIGGDQTQERKLAGDLVGMAQVAVPELAGVSSTARIAGAATKAPRAATPVQNASAAARDIGVTPSLGMGSKTAAMVAGGLEKIPFAGDVIAKDAARVVGEIDKAFKGAVARIGRAVGPLDAGSVLQGGLGAYVDRFKTKASGYYDAVAQYLPAGSKVRADNTLRAIEDSKAAFADNPELAAKLGLTQWDRVAAEAAQNGMSWQAMRQFRTRIGEAMRSNGDVLAGEGIGKLKQLYAALSDDMAAAAKAAGPDAERTWNWANTYYQKGAQRIDTQLDKLITAKSPERAFEAFDAMAAQDRASSDVRRMLAIKASLKPGEWNQISASIVDRLGKARPGAQGAAGDTFSPSAFLTEWNKMSPEAKRVLMPEEVRIELDKLAGVAERVKASGAERNTSNTATAENIARSAVGLAVAPTTTVAVLAGANVTARALTNPIFLRAMNAARAGKADGLRAMAAGRGPFAADAAEVLRLMAAEAAAAPANTDAPAVLRQAR